MKLMMIGTVGEFPMLETAREGQYLMDAENVVFMTIIALVAIAVVAVIGVEITRAAMIRALRRRGHCYSCLIGDECEHERTLPRWHGPQRP